MREGVSQKGRNDPARMVGVTALLEAMTFVFGFVLFATVLADYTSGDSSPAESAAFLADHQTTFYLWHLVILIIFGVVLVVLSVSLRDLLAPVSPPLATVTMALGLIWAGLVIAAGMIANIGIGTVSDLLDSDPTQAATVWSSLDTVQNGLGGGNEVVGGLWTLLVSLVALRGGLFPRALAVLGLVAGLAGVVTIVPALEDVGAVFGLGLIVWFAWLGFLMLGRASSGASTHDRARGQGTSNVGA
jgi:predicted membrane protein